MSLQYQQKANILIVDDIADNLKVLGDLLRGEGYKVRPVPNGTLALQVAEREKPDLILLDIMMPEMTGFEVCKKLKEKKNLQDVPVIFISALNETNDIVKALRIGGADYITKPFMAEEVKARVATQLKVFFQTKELQKLNADKDRFITILGHDLKSPFIGVLSFAELLSTNVREYDIDKTEKMVNIIHKSAKHFYSLLEDLLLWARAQSGKLSMNIEQIRLYEICLEIIDLLKLNAGNKDIQIELNVDFTITVLADRNMLSTILRNFISNAIKFTPRDGKITINATSAIDNTNITITDTGVGMSESTIQKLFDVTQIQSTAGTENETGTGFGLLLCKEFVEKQGGNISVESKENVGSTFTFSLKNS